MEISAENLYVDIGASLKGKITTADETGTISTWSSKLR